MNGVNSAKPMGSETDIHRYSAVMNMLSWQSTDIRESCWASLPCNRHTGFT